MGDVLKRAIPKSLPAANIGVLIAGFVKRQETSILVLFGSIVIPQETQNMWPARQTANAITLKIVSTCKKVYAVLYILPVRIEVLCSNYFGVQLIIP